MGRKPKWQIPIEDQWDGEDEIDNEVEDIIENYQTIEDIEKGFATKIPKRLPRKLDI